MNENSHKLVLVTGATGIQGGAVANEALKQGFKVRILVRNKAKAQELIKKGAVAVIGDFDDPDSLDNAMQNVDAVFSVPISGVDTVENDRERKQSSALIHSAVKNGVQQFVHTSVAATSRYKEFPKWGTGYWFEKYWTDKWDIEEAVRSAGFTEWTILKPAAMMENFTEKVKAMYPKFIQREIRTATFPDTHIDHIAMTDVAKFAVAAFADPEKFNHHSIELAAESLSYSEIAATISAVTGKTLKVVTLSPDEALAEGMHIYSVRGDEWNNTIGYNVDIDLLKNYGIKLTSFKEFAEKNKKKFEIS